MSDPPVFCLLKCNTIVYPLLSSVHVNYLHSSLSIFVLKYDDVDDENDGILIVCALPWTLKAPDNVKPPLVEFLSGSPPVILEIKTF